MTKDDVKKYLAAIGRKGGKVGGKANTPAKKQSSAANLEKARQKRWPKRKKRKGI